MFGVMFNSRTWGATPEKVLGFLVDSLAVMRLTDLVTSDEITRDIREAVIAKVGEDSKLAYLVQCQKCVSVWAGLLVASGALPKPVRFALAMSSATILLNEFRQVETDMDKALERFSGSA